MTIKSIEVDLNYLQATDYFMFSYRKQKDESIEIYTVAVFENNKDYFIGYVKGKGVRRFIKSRVQSVLI